MMSQEKFLKSMNMVMLVVMLVLASSNSNIKVVDAIFGIGTRVRIYNNLESRLDLTIHCKSADDDLGKQTLKYGEFFQWKFNLNFAGRTWYFCSFQWKGAFHWFDAYIPYRDARLCEKQCFYSITEKQPCLLRVQEHRGVCYNWNKDWNKYMINYQKQINIIKISLSLFK